MKIVENTPLRVIVITYEDDSLSDGTKQLMDLGKFGGVFKVTDQGTSGNYNLDQNSVLSNIFIQIISENLGTPLNKVRNTKKIICIYGYFYDLFRMLVDDCLTYIVVIHRIAMRAFRKQWQNRGDLTSHHCHFF